MKKFRFIIKALVLLFLQVILVDNIHIGGFCHPYIYILILLNLPIPIPRYREIIVAALVGLLIDMFSNSLGVHMFACATIGFIRASYLRNIPDIDRISGEVNGAVIGKIEYLQLLIVLIFVHHTLVFLLEAFSFQHFGYTLLEIIISGLVTLLFVAGVDFLKGK
ncbi:MAG: rod shape-determining protein MreD [Paludibacteraceae bacterium]|nr:rod shape-determining protein MreD [Paludibacteraceae bacterium]